MGSWRGTKPFALHADNWRTCEVTELATPGAPVSDPAPAGPFLTRRPERISPHVLFSLCTGDSVTLPCPHLLPSHSAVYGYMHVLMLVSTGLMHIRCIICETPALQRQWPDSFAISTSAPNTSAPAANPQENNSR